MDRFICGTLEFGEKETPGRVNNWGRGRNNNRGRDYNGDPNNNSGATALLPPSFDGPECESTFTISEKTRIDNCFQNVVYLIRPNLKVEGSYPFIMPVYDQVIVTIVLLFFVKFKIINLLFSQYNVTGEPEETNNVIIG